MGSRALPLVLAGALAGAVLLFGVSHTVRHQVTSERFYLDALQRERVYERVYEEVAADPGLARLLDPVFGHVPWARALTVSTLRLVVPPQTLRQGAEALVSGWTAYLRGERDTWPPPLEPDGVRSELLAGVSSHVAARIASAAGLESSSTAAFRRQVEIVLGDLVAGRVPAVVPSLPPLSEPEATRMATFVLAQAPVPPTPGTHEQIATALEAGDAHEALALAAPFYLDPALRQSLQGWRNRLDAGALREVVQALEGARSGSALATRTSKARSAVRWLGTPLALFSTLLALGAFAGLLWVVPMKGGSLVRWIGAALAGAGAAGISILLAGGSRAAAALAERVSGLSTEIPRSLVVLLSDVGLQLIDGLQRANMPVAAGLLVAGVLLLVSRPPAVLVHVRRSTDRTRRARLLAGGMAAAVLILLAAELWGKRAQRELMLCNGHRELCDRRLDEVVFAGTHNAMSAATLGWIFPNHDRWIEAQLESGYRALLIDAHYWGGAESIQRYLDPFPPEYRTAAVGALMRAAPPRPGVFLCHGLCGLGATPIGAGLAAIADFLRRNPNEVVMLSIEDYVSAEDVADAFRSSGLLDLVYDPEGSERWPTLREMIESDRRVVVLADHRGGDPSWYLAFAAYMQDTPAHVRTPDGFTCKHNRGDPEAPLLLINHWIATVPPDRVSAFRVNRRASLMAHVERCREERGMEPSIIAVDFSSIGDVLRVVDELNAGRR